MWKNLKKVFAEEYMRRPLLYMAGAKALIVLVLALLWWKLIDKGVHGLGFGFTVLGLILAAFAWFNYLSLDGVTIHHLLEGRKKKQKKGFHSADMVDYVDTPLQSFVELEKHERTWCRLISNLGDGLVFVVVGTILSLIL